MQTTLSPLRSADGDVVGIVGVGRDITQRIEAEQQVRQAQKMEAVGRFAGGVAHDLNNMMMIILGFSDFLLGALEIEDPRRGDADEIRKAAERAMHLTRQLLGFGRQRVVAREALSLNGVVDGMERMLRPLLGEDITLVTSLSPGLGGVEADYGQMEQVVMNLALNARDAMTGGGRLTIETMAWTSRTRIRLPSPRRGHSRRPLRPAGRERHRSGHDAEVKTHLFEPFFTTKAADAEHRPRPRDGLRHRGAERRLHLGGQRAGAGHELQHLLPRRGREAVRRRRAAPPASPRGTETMLSSRTRTAVRALAPAS